MEIFNSTKGEAFIVFNGWENPFPFNYYGNGVPPLKKAITIGVLKEESPIVVNGFILIKPLENGEMALFSPIEGYKEITLIVSYVNESGKYFDIPIYTGRNIRNCCTIMVPEESLSNDIILLDWIKQNKFLNKDNLMEATFARIMSNVIPYSTSSYADDGFFKGYPIFREFNPHNFYCKIE